MTDFKLNCCELFERFPLYNYRTPEAVSETRSLFVLLIGYGPRLETILSEVLTNGQLLDTDLDVTVVNMSAKDSSASLMEKAPYLNHFARILADEDIIANPSDLDRLCTLRFETADLTPEAMPEILAKHNKSSYIMISADNDPRNHDIAKECSRFELNHDTLIAYVQQNDTGEIKVMSPTSDADSFDRVNETAYFERLEKIALNLHYAYTKSENERARVDQIIQEFREPYNYVSNIEAASHLRSKLLCCGITESSFADAAAKFSKLITACPETASKLSVLEHKRWMMEKLLDGYHQLENLDLIYSRRDIKTHSAADKWHSCLVSCDPTGASHITAEDWKLSEKNINAASLDALDRMSLRLRRKCGQLSRANHARVDELLTTIRVALNEHTTFSRDSLAAETRMEFAISQMYQQKKSALPLYEREFRALKTRIETENKTQAFLLNESLGLLDTALLPLKEFISYKDYKAADRNSVAMIPFVLSHKTRPALVKILSDKSFDNLFSTWKLEPDSVTFIGFAADPRELTRVRRQAEIVRDFISDAELTDKIHWHIIVPASFPDLERAKEELSPVWNCSVCSAEALTLSPVSATLDTILDSAVADYLDVTGADPLIARAAETIASRKNIPTLYVKDSAIHNLFGAPELEYPSPRKGMTVSEMFALSGAVIEDSEGSRLSDLSKNYEKFWQIAQSASSWNVFCEYITAAYNETEKPQKSFSIADPGAKNARASFILKADVAAALLPVMRELEELGYISKITISSESENLRNISFKAPGETTADNLRSGLIDLCSKYTSSSSFTLKKSSDRVRVILSDLSVRNLKLPEPEWEEYQQILTDLANCEILLNLTRDSDDMYSFQFASADVRNAFQMSGRVLEFYVYYSALLEGHFNDVNMGWKFLHTSSENSAENELDVICVKGVSALFISAKMVSAASLKTKLNYVLYEISILTDRFGVNAVPVLAAPRISRYETDDQGVRKLSNEARSALKRGVFLLGAEYFQSSAVLGKTLDQIMDGNTDIEQI